MPGDTQRRYATHGPLTDPGPHARALDGLPPGIGPLAEVVQGLLIHDSGLHLYGLTAADFAGASRATKPVAERLERALACGPLIDARPPVGRIFGTCRDYALMLTAFLRHRRMPARVRCGFASYLRAGVQADHWICEYWIDGERRWARADAQLDQPHRAALDVAFDLLDLPAGAFLTAGEAWRHIRAGEADPESFGHGAARGAWFVRVNLARDLLALAGREVSDWDGWRDALPESHLLTAEALAWCDAAAEAASAVDRDPEEAVALAATCGRPFWR